MSEKKVPATKSGQSGQEASLSSPNLVAGTFFPRRSFLARSTAVAATSALAGVTVPAVHAAEDPTIRLALIGCGSRGAGAVADALAASGGPVRLYAMADVSRERIESKQKALTREFGDRIDVPAERRFVGFDAYRHAIDSLRPGDVAMLTTRAYCRPLHFDHAVAKGVNIFMEKTFAADPAGIHRMLATADVATQKNLKVACGLQCRHSVNRQALIDRIREGELGDIPLVRAVRHGGTFRLPPYPAGRDELEWQIQNSVGFLWASSGLLLELLIHQIDECCWVKDAWPVAAEGLCGRVPGSTERGQNLDVYSLEYTFADGGKAIIDNRNLSNCHYEFATYLHGTKRAAQFSGNNHKGLVHLYRDRVVDPKQIDWRMPDEVRTPWQAEWQALLDAIRNDTPHDETRRSCLANLAAIMGRAAAHGGQVVTWEQIMQSRFAFCPEVDELRAGSPPPVQQNDAGAYPAPEPGRWKEV